MALLQAAERMDPKQAWGVLGLFVVIIAIAACALLWNAGVDVAPVATIGVAVVITFGYIAYKRYNVEVIPEDDIMLFDDPDDLALLCGIYGLDHKGDEATLRSRLIEFVRRHRHEAFVWVAPKAVMSLGNALSFERRAATPSVQVFAQPRPATLPGGKQRSETRRKRIVSCPVCDAKVPGKGGICGECGADLEFYVVLSELKVGRLVLSGKRAGAVRRKLRYEVPTLGGPR